MCLISFQWQPNSQTPLVMVGNRDEFHARPARASQFWPDIPQLFAGQDLEAGGTWMGVTSDGRFAALTNVRLLPAPVEVNEADKISRGQLVLDYLSSQQPPSHYLEAIVKKAHFYEGFNLVVGNREECWYLGNRNQLGPQALQPGLYGLSNAQLNSPWPKTLYAKQALQNWLEQPDAQLYNLLKRRETYEQHLLPNTGIGEPFETLLSAPFIISPNYGTRACSGLQIHQSSIQWQEGIFNPQGELEQLVEQTLLPS